MPGEIAFLWHLHQPPYEDPETGAYLLPWVRLHATRGYLDLADIHLRFPEVRSTVNFSPILLEQLEAYAEGRARDRFLEIAARPAADLSEAERLYLLRRFFMVSWEQGIRPFPRYRALLDKRGRSTGSVDFPRIARTFTEAELRDLQVLFQLAWMGFFARRESELVRELVTKGENFTEEEKEALLAEQARLVARVIPMWKQAAAQGSVELSASPYAHPILPLLCDTDVARVALPQARRPERLLARDDAKRQVRLGMQVHERVFGRSPAGMWPSEGSVSDEALDVLWQAGIQWVATDEEILLRSLPGADLREIYRPWKVRAGRGEMHVVFRDRRLSDRIGFVYARASARDAVDDLLGEVSRIQSGLRRRALVSIILDGENPWEYYPASGEAFLGELFSRLARREGGIVTWTMSETLAWNGPTGRLDHIHPGSWIEGSFRIWIGHPEDVAAWNLVRQTKDAVDQAAQSGAGEEELAVARAHLLRAEASDWFWWYGEDFVTETRTEFDLLFRHHIQAAFRALGREPPAASLSPLIPEGVEFGEALVAREPAGFVRPRIDGQRPSYWEWLGAGLYVPGLGQAMYRADGPFARMYFGFDERHLFLRLDPRVEPRGDEAPFDRLGIVLRARGKTLEIEGRKGPDGDVELRLDERVVGSGRFVRILELALPFSAVGAKEGDRIGVAVRLFRAGLEVQRLPVEDFLALEVPGPGYEEARWKV